jgi:hypothetical protein
MDILSVNPENHAMSDCEKLKYIFTTGNVMYLLAKTCFSILHERKKIHILQIGLKL